MCIFMNLYAVDNIFMKVEFILQWNKITTLNFPPEYVYNIIYI